MDYRYTLLDPNLAEIEEFDIPNTSNIELVAILAEEYLNKHSIPVGTLNVENPVTGELIKQIDILL